MSIQIEHIIRDWLAAHPEFIEKGLQVVGKEHYLFDEMGSSGFIDILCKDLYNNFVIVEIKRSDSAARQTFTGVFKYAELIQNRYNARNSEIRIIIISTHWNEIIRAFSHICFKSRFAVQGLQIYINEHTKIPEVKEEVIPISTKTFSRKFMSSQILYLFHSVEKRQKVHTILSKKLEQANIPDFVTVDLNAPDDKQIIYPYAINVAFQKYSKDELLYSVSLLQGESHLDMQEEEFDTEEDYLHYLEQVFIVSLEMSNCIDSLEAGSAEKFESIINVQNWEITALNRYGIFNTDPRYSRELLIKELKGHDGNSPNKFVGFSESNQKERISEIRSECQYSLGHTPHWSEFIEFILSGLEKSNEKFKIIVDVYNPESIVTALYFTLIKGNPDYLPLFLIFIDYPDLNKTEIYKGEIKSLGTKPTLKLFTSENYDDVSNELLRVWLTPENEIDAIKMGLCYTVQKTVFIDDNEVSNQFIVIDDKEIIADTHQYISIENYIISNKHSLSAMLRNYSNFAKQM